MNEANEVKRLGLPAQLARECLRAAATGANEIPASQYVIVPDDVVAWLLTLLDRHPDEQVREFFKHELLCMVEVDNNGEAVAVPPDDDFADFAGDYPGCDASGDAEPSEPEYPAEAAGHWIVTRRFRVDALISPCAGQSLN